MGHNASRLLRMGGLILGLWLTAPAGALSQEGQTSPPANASSGSTDSPITANVVIGVDPEKPFRREYAWVPVRVELSNTGKDVEGQLVIRIKDGKIIYQTPVQLPNRSLKSYTLYVYLPLELDELAFTLETRKETIDLAVVTVATPATNSRRLVAVLSPERGSHERLGHRPEEEVDVFREVAYTSTNLLPRSWIGYQDLDVLIWDGAEASELNSDQEQALDQWIQMGGTLVLAVGDKWQVLNASPLRLYSPVTMTGSRVMEASASLAALDEAIQPKVQPSVVIATGEVMDDPNLQVRLKAGDDPFLIERPWGAGHIVWIAGSVRSEFFEPSLQRLFNNFITTAPAPITTRISDQLDSFLTAFLRGLVQAELPGTAFIAIYLGCYILILGPVNYLLFRQLRRLEWAWFTIPFWAVVFAYGAYYIGALRQRGEVIANSISIMESKPNANVASVSTLCSLYSPIRKWYTLQFTDPPAYPRLPVLFDTLRGAIQASDSSLVVSYGPEGPRLEDYLVYHWSQRTFKSQHAVPIGHGVAMDLRWDDRRVKGTVVNHTGMVLHQPRLYLRERYIPLLDLQDGDSAVIDHIWDSAYRLESSQLWNRLNSLQSDFSVYQHDTAKMISTDLTNFYAALLFEDSFAQGMVVLAAQVDLSPLRFWLNGEAVNPHGSSLLCVHFPLRQIFYGAITIPLDSWHHSLGVTLGGDSRSNAGFAQSNSMFVPPNSDYMADMFTDMPMQFGKVEFLKVKVQYERFTLRYSRPSEMNNPYMSIAGKPAEKKYEIQLQDRLTLTYFPLSEVAGPNGALRAPERFLDKEFGRIKYRITSPEMGVVIPHDAFQIEMKVNFGGENRQTFLGYPLDL